MIVVRLMGGLGNQMFQYAFGRALSLRNNCRLKLDLTSLLDRTPRPKFSFREYQLGIFDLTVEAAQPTEIPFPHRRHLSGRPALHLDRLSRMLWPCSGRERHFHFDPDFLEIGRCRYMQGHWQTPRYFENVEDVIRKDFTLREPLSGLAEKLRVQISNERSVCVHVRRGDFVDNSLHGTLGPDYYEAALRRVTYGMPSAHVHVFSDDIGWCRRHLRFPYETSFVGDEYAGPSPSYHLACMSACRAFVISNSSFGWWAAWLGRHPEKIVVAPKRWFMDTSINTADLIPKGWIRV